MSSSHATGQERGIPMMTLPSCAKTRPPPVSTHPIPVSFHDLPLHLEWPPPPLFKKIEKNGRKEWKQIQWSPTCSSTIISNSSHLQGWESKYHLVAYSFPDRLSRGAGMGTSQGRAVTESFTSSGRHDRNEKRHRMLLLSPWQVTDDLSIYWKGPKFVSESMFPIINLCSPP